MSTSKWFFGIEKKDLSGMSVGSDHRMELTTDHRLAATSVDALLPPLQTVFIGIP